MSFNVTSVNLTPRLALPSLAQLVLGQQKQPKQPQFGGLGLSMLSGKGRDQVTFGQQEPQLPTAGDLWADLGSLAAKVAALRLQEQQAAARAASTQPLDVTA